MSTKSNWKTRLSCTEMSEDVLDAWTLLNNGHSFICFDLETTGRSSKKARIIQYCGIRFRKENGVFHEIDRFSTLINPEMHIPEEASAVNNITDDMVKDCPTEREACEMIMNFQGATPHVCGYNSVKFDERFMNAMYERQFQVPFTRGVHIDVLKMAKEKLNLKSYRLSEVTSALGFDTGIQFHDAAGDLLATMKVMEYLMNEYVYPEQESPPVRFSYWKNPDKNRGMHYKRMSYRNEYVYVDTYPFSKTLYDVYRKEWRSDAEAMDLKSLRCQIFKKEEVTNEKEMLAKAQNSAACVSA